MTLAQHSSKNDRWYTPKWLKPYIHHVIYPIDIDPASDSHGNLVMGASRYWTREINSLSFAWYKKFDEPVTMFCNPPGGKIRNKSKSVLFWQKLITLRHAGLLKHAIFLAFSIEQLQTSQSCSSSMLEFPLCIPDKRLAFEDRYGWPQDNPTHANAIIYVPGTRDQTDTFMDVFSSIGAVK